MDMEEIIDQIHISLSEVSELLVANDVNKALTKVHECLSKIKLSKEKTND